MNDDKSEKYDKLKQTSLREFISVWVERHPERTILIIIIISSLLVNYLVQVSISAFFTNPIYLLSGVVSLFFFYISMQLNKLITQKEKEVKRLELVSVILKQAYESEEDGINKNDEFNLSSVNDQYDSGKEVKEENK